MKLRVFQVLLLFTLFLTPGLAQTEDFISIVSFNIAEFGEGKHPTTRDIDYIAQMLVGEDLVEISHLITL